MIREHHVRPAAPDPVILERALDRARGPAGARWVVGPRMDRSQSTLFPLKLQTPGGVQVLEAFYKAHRIKQDASPDEVRSKLTTFLRVLERGGALAEEFARLSAGLPVDVPLMLASDTAQLTEVQLALPGRALAHVSLRALPGWRESARRSYRRLGRALALIEQCRDADLAAAEAPTFDTTASTRGLQGALGEQGARRLRGLLEELQRALDAAGTFRYAHGDVSSGNVLATRTRLGLIDPLWSIRWPGSDPAQHAARLQAELIQYPAWTRDLLSEMLEGYGDASLPTQPIWQFMALVHRAGLARSASRRPAARLRRQRAIRDLQRTLGPPVG